SGQSECRTGSARRRVGCFSSKLTERRPSGRTASSCGTPHGSSWVPLSTHGGGCCAAGAGALAKSRQRAEFHLTRASVLACARAFGRGAQRGVHAGSRGLVAPSAVRVTRRACEHGRA